MDERAAALASAVLAGGREGTGALLTALRESGIGVRDISLGDRVVLPPAEPSQGLALQAWELLAMAQLEERGFAASLEDVANVLRVPGLGLEAAPLEGLLVSAIRAHARGDHPALRFWARFVIELGRQGPGGYDLLDPDERAAVSFDAAQTLLVLHRLAGDAYALGAQRGDGAPAPAVGGLGMVGSILPAGLPHVLFQTRRPCSLSETESSILDHAAAIGSLGFGEIWDLAGVGDTRAGTFLSLAGYVLTLARFIAIQFVFDPRIELVGGPPLRRTDRTTVDEERRQLRATIRMNTGNAQTVNCLRLILNGAGLDFNLPQDGPVVGAEVLWRCVEGCGIDGPVMLCALPCTGAGGIQSGDPSRNAFETLTDGNGVATTGIQGRRQRREIPTDAALQWERSATVAITVKLVTPSLFSDLAAAGETAVGSYLDPGGTTLSFVLDLADRFGVRGATYRFPVIDWQLPAYAVTYRGRWNYEGVKCDGPAGRWVIDISAPNVSGTVRIEMDERTLTGPATTAYQHSTGVTYGFPGRRGSSPVIRLAS